MRHYTFHVIVSKLGIEIQPWTCSRCIATMAMLIEDMFESKTTMVTLTTEPLN